MDHEKYFHHPTKCPHCGYINIGGASYCGDCGNLIYIPRILTRFEKFIELKVPQSVHKTEKIESIFACELERESFGYRYRAMEHIGAGDLAIDFCGCKICNRLQDELVEYYMEFDELYNSVRLREKRAERPN